MKLLKTIIHLSLVGSFLTAALFFSACSNEPDFTDQPVQLIFSADTIQFDTLFTGRQSITKRLKIKNPGNKAVNIESISLDAQFQVFNLILNGRSGNSFNNQLLLPEDSLLLLIEATVDQSNENNPFVIRDQLSFQNKGITQEVVLEAWGQNAVYLKDTVLTCNSRWNAEKPYVLAGTVVVDSSCVLSIEAGVKIYSAVETFLVVYGSMQAEGNVENPIIFTNDRLDEPFASAAGQWGGIVLLAGSRDNYFKYTTIKNAFFGVNLNTFQPDGNPDLVMENCFVGNMVLTAILALNSDFSAVNSVFYNTASGTVSHVGGGSASYTHCTIANYFNVSRDQPAALFSDYAIDNSQNEIIAPIEVNMVNTIIFGRIADEILFYEEQAGNLSLSLSHNFYKTSLEILQANQSILNLDPRFQDPTLGDFHLTDTSPARGVALPSNILLDIVDHPRLNSPDIGAFQYAEIEE